jgi:hypothetical protein
VRASPIVMRHPLGQDFPRMPLMECTVHSLVGCSVTFRCTIRDPFLTPGLIRVRNFGTQVLQVLGNPRTAAVP